jgi:DNA-binding response OmpR family regulator
MMPEKKLTPDQQRKAIDATREALAGKPVRVLLVEDDKLDAEITRGTLLAAGITSDWCKDSVETEAYLQTQDPTLVFLDLKLGTAERGLNVLGLIKAMKPGCTVAILSGVYQHDAIECQLALDRGAVGLFRKPLGDDAVRFIFSTP